MSMPLGDMGPRFQWKRMEMCGSELWEFSEGMKIGLNLYNVRNETPPVSAICTFKRIGPHRHTFK